MVILPGCLCCGCSENCCRTVTYGYMDTEPPGKWYDECPGVGNCLTGSSAIVGDCAGDVIEGYIVERFCKQSIEGKDIHAYLRMNSAIDDFGTIAGVNTDVACGRLGVITADHDITAELEFEDDGAYLIAKVPFLAENGQVGGPFGAAGVVICWCCVDPEDPPPEGESCPCCDVSPPDPPPLKYDCVDGECIEVGEGGEYDEPACGGECLACQRCVTIYRSRFQNDTKYCAREDVYELEVNIPAAYSFPLTVRITGSVDDDLKISGTLIEDNVYEFQNEGCNGAHCVGGGPVGYTTTISSSPMTLTLVDNFGQGRTLDLTVCLDPDGEQNVNECPTVTYVSSVGENWTARTDACCVQPNCAGDPPADSCRCNPLP